MNLYETFKSNPAAETEGIEIPLGDNAWIKVARAGGGNKRFVETYQRLTKPYGALLDGGNLDGEVAQKLNVQVYAEAVLLDWKGVTDAKGKELEPTVENRVKVLTDLPELLNKIVEISRGPEAFRSATVEATAKN